MALWALVVAACFAVVSSSRATVNKCLTDYIPKISSFGLDTTYLHELGNFLKTNQQEEVPKVKVVLDVGLGSMWHSDVFRHVGQLNMSGFDQHGRSVYNCEHERIPKSDVYSFREYMIRNSSDKASYLYSLGSSPLLTNAETWLKVLAFYPNVKVLMNDVSDEEYYSNQHSASCIEEWQPRLEAHCFVPLPLPRQFNASSPNHLLSRFSLDQVKIMSSAYRSLIRCIVPPENLFEFNLNQMPRLAYWKKLTSFLNVKVPVSGPKYLSEGGTVCENVKLHDDKRHLTRVKCADEYSDTIASIYGERYRNYVRGLLLNSIDAPHRAPENTDRLVLGIGPGTSGTRTVHFSVTQLNVTSLHYQALFARSALGRSVIRHHFDVDMKALELESADRRVFWSDTPVPNRWWYLYKLYPNTNFMITDVRNDTAWRESRFYNHCNKTMRINEPSCTAPLPIRYDKSVLAMEFFRLSQIKIADVETVHRTYDAYRALAKCVIPSEKLWWVYLPELKSSEEYWTKLIALVGAKLSDKQKKEFIARGIPRCGSAGCYWNDRKYKVNY